MRIDTMYLAGPGDLAKRYDVTPGAVGNWQLKSDFPLPVVRLSCGSIWDWREVDNWVEQRRKNVQGLGIAPVHRRFVGRMAADCRKRSKRGMLRWVVYDRHAGTEVPDMRYTSLAQARSEAVGLEWLWRRNAGLNDALGSARLVGA